MSLLLLLNSSAGASPTAPTYATWNDADKDPVLVLSNSDRTATAGSVGSGSIRATLGLATGKWRFKVTDASALYTQVGVGTAAADVTAYAGSDEFAWAFSSHAYWYHGGNATGPSSGQEYGPSSVIDCYVNLDDDLFYLYVDGVLAGGAARDISSRGSDEIFPMGGFFSNGNTFTINCGQEDMGTPVTGFEAYLPWWQA